MPMRRAKGQGRKKARAERAEKVQLSTEVKAQLIAEADTTPGQDATIAARYGISLRSLQRHRKQASEPGELSALVARKKALIEGEWRDEALKTIRLGAQTIRTLFALAEKEALNLDAKGEPFPEGRLKEVAGAWHLVAAELTSKDMIGAVGDTEGSAAPEPTESGPEDPGGAEEASVTTH